MNLSADSSIYLFLSIQSDYLMEKTNHLKAVGLLATVCNLTSGHRPVLLQGLLVLG